MSKFKTSSDDLSTQVETSIFLKQIVNHEKLPLIAAGGIHLQKRLRKHSRGTSAVCLGTAYLLCPETKPSQIYRDALKTKPQKKLCLQTFKALEPARGIINRLISEIGSINTDTPEFPLASAAVSSLHK